VLEVVWVGKAGCWERVVDFVAAVLQVSKQLRFPLLVGPCDCYFVQVDAVVGLVSVAVFRSAHGAEADWVPGLAAAVAYLVVRVRLVEVCRWAGEEVPYFGPVMCEQKVHHLVSLARERVMPRFLERIALTTRTRPHDPQTHRLRRTGSRQHRRQSRPRTTRCSDDLYAYEGPGQAGLVSFVVRA
jgi:hypothetical protein